MQSHRILRHFLDQQSFGDCAAGGAPGGGRAFSAAALASFSSDFPMGGLSPPWTPCASQLTLRAPSTPCASWARHGLGSLSATEWQRIRLLEWASHLRLLQMVDCTPKRAIWPSSTGSDSGADSGTESAAEAAAAAGKVVEKPAADGKRKEQPRDVLERMEGGNPAGPPCRNFTSGTCNGKCRYLPLLPRGEALGRGRGRRCRGGVGRPLPSLYLADISLTSR